MQEFFYLNSGLSNARTLLLTAEDGERFEVVGNIYPNSEFVDAEQIN
jgi:hypothetical protein